MTCLDCKFHGPPVSDYQGPKPCADCIPHPGFPKWEPVAFVGKDVDTRHRVCNDPFHPEWDRRECQCVNCQPQNYCVEDSCADCTGPVDGCEPPDEDDNHNEKGE